MKIGILTLPLETNYGGNLQAFALQKILNRMGHDAITIDRHKKKQYPPIFIRILYYFRRLYLFYIKKNKRISTKWNYIPSDIEYAELSALTQNFISRNIKLTRKIYSEQLNEIEEEYKFDAYVVGSDQVWLDSYCPNSFLDFVKRDNVIKIAYAASTGKSSFFNNPNKVSICKILAQQFSGISVREEYLVDLCKDNLTLNVSWVLDPTMLLTHEDYLSATINKVGDAPVVFSYILDPSDNKDFIIDFISKKMHYPIVNGNIDKKYQKSYPSIDDWINNINRAKFVVTDSFHGTVFAILFNKPFISIANRKRGIDRFLSLLRIFSLESRMVMEDSYSNLPSILNEYINYSQINKILDEKREYSKSFLYDILNNQKFK